MWIDTIANVCCSRQLPDDKADLLGRMGQFRGRIESLAPDSRWVPMLPKAFSVTEGMGRVIPPLDACAPSGFHRRPGQSQGLLHPAHANATNAVGLARGARNETQAAIYEILKQYRKRIPSEFAEDSAILETLPRLTPLSGATPPAVDLPRTAVAFKVYTITGEGNEKGSSGDGGTPGVIEGQIGCKTGISICFAG